jgi:hypothetical protein
MSSVDFCIWLKRFLDGHAGPLTGGDVLAIRRRLDRVFIHEIDPAMGDPAHQAALNKIHSGTDDYPAPAAPAIDRAD